MTPRASLPSRFTKQHNRGGSHGLPFCGSGRGVDRSLRFTRSPCERAKLVSRMFYDTLKLGGGRG